MDTLPGSIGVVGTQKEIEIFDLLKEFLDQYEGLLGFKIPSIGIKDKNDIPSFIGIIENHCIFIIDIVDKKCLSPLNSWTKFGKQFCNNLNLGYEKHQTKIYT